MDDDETWLSGPSLSSSSSITTPSSTSSSSKGTQSDLDSWLSTGTSSNIDFSTRSALSRKLKGYSEKKARRRKLRSASTISLESVSEESLPPPHKVLSDPSDEDSLESIEDDLDTTTLVPVAASSPVETKTTVVERRSIDEGRGRSIDHSSLSIDCGAFGVGAGEDEDVEFKQLEEEEEYKQLEEDVLGLSIQDEGREVDQQEDLETTQDDDEFLSAASEFEDEELEAAHQNGRSRELESLDEEPVRMARHQVLGGARLGAPPPRSSSVSPRLAATVHPTTVTPKTAVTRVVSSEITNTPVSTMNTLPRRPQVEAAKGGGMSVSLHMSTGHLPPRRVPPSRGTENGKSTVGGGGTKEEKKKVNLHEDLAKIQDVAREQEEALRREVMGSLSANDVSNGENDARLITNSKSVEFVGGGGKKEFHSRLPTPSRRVIPVRAPSRGGGGTLPLRAAPNSVGSGCPVGGGISSVSQSRSTTGSAEQDSEDGCF